MLKKIKLLLELQELDLVLKEAKIVHGKWIDSKSVSDKISKIRERVDKQTLSRYDRLIKQGLSVVQFRNGMCLGCNLSIPIGDINRMTVGSMAPICTNCGKFIDL